MNEYPLAAALEKADMIHDGPVLERAIVRIGAEIDRELDGSDAVFLTVMQGALVFAGRLAIAISTPLEFDYVHATRYHGGTRGTELKWLAEPRIALSGRTVILVDDILDEGHTLNALREYCRAQGAARVLIAVLCAKRHGRCVAGLDADFTGVDVPDRYVFGYGMDYHEQGRNLAAIWAVDA